MEKQKEMEGKMMKLKEGMIRGGPNTPSITWRLHSHGSNNSIQELLNNTATCVSARKLCATFWEIHPHLNTPKLTSNPHQKKKKKKKKKDPLNDPPEQAANASSSRRHVAHSLNQHHKSTDRTRDAQQSLSSSSIKVAHLNLVESPTNFLDFKGRVGESSYSLKTSSELRKVLGRIWSLEGKQSSNMSLLKSLKFELNRSHSQIKELLKEKQSNRQEMDCLMLQVAEDKVSRKNKVQDQVKAVIQSARAELEGERKLRKHSESLHRKLTRELSQVKCAFSNALRELERERKARILLENLCDEFAKGIRDYEQVVRSLRHKSDMDRVGRGKPDSLILHISEAWLDERMQTRLAENQQNGVTEKDTIVDKLSPDIETFLLARCSNGLREIHNKAINNCTRRESFPLNEAVSAPQDALDEEDSIDSDSRCFELNKSASRKQNAVRSKVRVNHSSEHHKLNKNQSVSSEGDKIHPEDNMNEDTYVHQQEWKSKLESLEKIDKSEPSLQLPGGIKENTLKAKLLEARLEGRTGNIGRGKPPALRLSREK